MRAAEAVGFNGVEDERVGGSRACDFPRSRGARVLCCFPRGIVVELAVELAVVRAVEAAGFNELRTLGSESPERGAFLGVEG